MDAPGVPPTGADATDREPVDVADVLADDETYVAAGEKRRRTRRTRRLAAALLVLGVVVGVYGAGRPSPSSELPSGHPEVSSSEQAFASVDTEVEAELLARLQQDPRDVDAMRRLGTLYYGAGDFARTAQWQQEILAVEPRDVDALLALGVAEFSQGDLAGAEEHWGAALAISPDQAEVYYNLGFLHLSQDAPDRALEDWDRVLELAPDSDMAATVASHRDALAAQVAGTGTED